MNLVRTIDIRIGDRIRMRRDMSSEMRRIFEKLGFGYDDVKECVEIYVTTNEECLVNGASIYDVQFGSKFYESCNANWVERVND